MARSLRALTLFVLGLALARSAWAVPPTITIAQLQDGDVVKLAPAVAGSLTGTSPFTVTLRVDAGPEVDATTVTASGYLGTVTLPSEGPHTITATATNADGSANASIMVIGDGTPPVVTISAPLTGFETGDRTVDVTATVADANLDPNDPNTLRVNGTSIPVDPNDPNSFHGKAPVNAGSHTLFVRAQDRAGNVSNDPNDISVTRTVVCTNPTAPQAQNNDPNAPHFIIVDRLDDLVLPPGFDPNADPAQACDIRPDLHTDPNTPFRPPAGKCTLRGALQLANAHPGPDVIRLPSQEIRLTRQGAGEDAGLRGDLDVTDDLYVVGLGRDVSTIDGRKLADRVFDVHPGVSFTIVLATVRGGRTPKKSGDSGGCVRVVGPRNTVPDDPNDPNDMKPSFEANNLALIDCKADADGGALALELQGPDDFSKVTCGIVARSSAKKDGGGILLDGGALTLRGSTIALASSGGIGGALADRAGSLVMTDATISTNKAKLSGGGLALANGADATLNNVTFAKNKAKRGTSLSTSTGSANQLDVSNSILGDKPKATCDVTGTSPLVSHGGNLDPGTTCDLSDPNSDLENADPRLDKLATNVGIPTHALKADSPAIDHGVFATCEPLDERDADRVDGPPVAANPPNPDQCDSGAFEFASEAPPPLSGPK